MTKINTTHVPASDDNATTRINVHPNARGVSAPASVQTGVKVDAVTRLPKRQVTHADGTVTATSDTRNADPNAWNIPWEESVKHLVTPPPKVAAPALPHRNNVAFQKPPSGPRRHVVGSRIALFEANIANKNPQGKPEGDWSGDEQD